MKENKNIERLFQEKFKDFEVTPPDFVWDNIQEKLNPEKKKRRVIPFWFKASGIAASFVALFSILYYNSDTNTSSFDAKGFENNATSVSKSNDNASSVGHENGSNISTGKGNNIESNNSKSHTNANAFESKNETVSKENNSKIGSSINEKTSNKNSVSKRKNNQTNWNTQITSTQSSSRRNSEGNGSVSKRNSIRKGRNNNSNWDNQLVGTNSTLKKKFKGKSKKTKTTISDDLLFNRSENLITQNDKNSNNTQKLNKELNDSNNISNLNPFIIANNSSFSTENTTNSNNNTLTTVEEPKADSIALATVAIEENPLEKLLREKEKKVAPEKEDFSKWAVNSYISPIYFNSFSEGSPLSQEFASNDKTFNNSTSYGVGLSYKVNKKIAVKAGINNLNLDYSTNDIAFYSTFDDQTSRSDDNIRRNRNGKYLVLRNQIERTVNLGENELFVAGQNSGNLNQAIQYIEVPLGMSYALLDKKFGISVMGGMSTLFLTKNSVSIDTEDGQMEIGKASNLNTVHFSSNIGLGFSYDFMKNFQAIIEPTLKYQINTFNENAGNFKPYVVGINTGISYKF